MLRQSIIPSSPGAKHYGDLKICKTPQTLRKERIKPRMFPKKCWSGNVPSRLTNLETDSEGYTFWNHVCLSVANGWSSASDWEAVCVALNPHQRYETSNMPPTKCDMSLNYSILDSMAVEIFLTGRKNLKMEKKWDG